jgi:fermentation-respiration switch protein FrsA (DUF1100 family)
VIHGSNDQIVPFESTGKLAAEMIKNATLKVYDNAPHGFALTHQDQLNEDLLGVCEVAVASGGRQKAQLFPFIPPEQAVTHLRQFL